MWGGFETCDHPLVSGYVVYAVLTCGFIVFCEAKMRKLQGV